ncbi:hypothetical protein SADUNF_Sadunf01G0126700 [Salix dunnii]|uniref:Uncharacterized protein n=1 Tax=Salix dunnii TaxID=1413687 RepID=A0A835NBI4_9ROSI|nr:hypothetical protein SADUNF_Sadunf01G0126700 [Salix dunnii]
MAEGNSSGWVDDLNGEISDYDEESVEEPRDETGLEPRDETELEPRVETLEIEDDGQIPEYAHSLGNALEYIDNEFSEMTGNDVNLQHVDDVERETDHPVMIGKHKGDLYISSPYTTEQTGTVERLYRTIRE